ncbi:RagB/SusD family nutrient uptake outer membrane protein [Pedobacter agri]|uniref:RagB/SusD family nutrient uptake outer membrane protein n=1 Tax=Pedobacter agri TaxID=454586 RepID=UPI0029311790|nr:RagB/SusD family nutrient uptake outer membrane protein [Pedobacter agri]
MKRFKIVAFLAIALHFVGCDIDRTPYDSLTPEDLSGSEGSLQSVTDGNYARLKTMALGWHRVMEFGSDNLSLSGTTTSHLFNLYNYQRLEANSLTTSFWTNSYQVIASCNKMIETVEEGKSDQSNQLLGENYFLRAYLHFTLVNVFSKPYSHGSAGIGIPIKTNSDPNQIPVRTSIISVYEQVLSDLNKAVSLLNQKKSNAYASKEVAYALLSRVYLYMGDNQKCIDNANLVINSGRYQLLPTQRLASYPTIRPEDNTETIFAVKFIPNADLIDAGFSNIGSIYSVIQNVGYGEMYASKPYIELLRKYPTDERNKFISPVYLNNGVVTGLYADDAFQYKSLKLTKVNVNDYSYLEGSTTRFLEKETGPDGRISYFANLSSGTRKAVTIEPEMANRNGYPKYYIIKCSNQENQPQLWSPVVFRLAEMYLNRAEAFAKLGENEKALADVNLIRTRAGIPQNGLFSANALPNSRPVLDLVLDEDRLEFAYEGHRKFDVFRNKRDMDRRYPGTHLAGNTPISIIKWSDNNIIELIPQSQMLIHPGLVQNPL